MSETSEAEHGADGQVHALSFDHSGEAVTFTALNAQPSGGDLPCHLRIDSAEKSLIVTNYGSGTAGALPLQADGSLGEMSALVAHRGRGPRLDRQDGPHAHSAIFTPDGEYVIVADLGLDVLVIYRYMDGRLAKARDVPTASGAGPRHLAFHPNGRVLYVANELNGTLSAYDYQAGDLIERETLDTLPEDTPVNLVADLQVAPAGERVFVSNRGHNSLAVYSATSEGALRLLTIADCGGNWPRNFALSPDGRFILVANQYSGEVVSLPLQPGAGEIGAPVARTAVQDVSCVVFATGSNIEYNEGDGVEQPVQSDVHRRAL